MKLDDAVHIAHGDHAAQVLLGLGAKKVLVRRDLLTVGPCHPDPAQHRALRRAFWGGDGQGTLPGVDADEDLKRELTGPAVLWASGAWSDLTFLWALVDALVRIGADRPFVVRPGLDDPMKATGATTGSFGPDQLRAAFDAVEPLRDDVGRSCIAFWQAYVEPSPLAFDELRRRAVPFVPSLDRVLEGHGAWFPWRETDGLRMADADAAILRGDDQKIMSWVGDSIVARRRAELGARDPDARFSSVAELPPLWVGGCRVNDPASPWLRVREGAGWRISA